MAYKNYAQVSKEPKDYTGMRFGRLTALKRGEDAIIPSSGKRIVRYLCKCDCGNEKLIRKAQLTNGSVVSCGCYHREQVGNMNRTHGYSHKERLYSVWLDIKERCRNPKNNHYKCYGGRGITVCKEWADDYLSFRKWALNNGYREDIKASGRNNITIDRIDVDGNYEPSNCRWITNRENCLNKRNTMSDDERYCVCPICGKTFEMKKRNQQKTCSRECGIVYRYGRSKRNADSRG